MITLHELCREVLPKISDLVDERDRMQREMFDSSLLPIVKKSPQRCAFLERQRTASVETARRAYARRKAQRRI